MNWRATFFAINLALSLVMIFTVAQWLIDGFADWFGWMIGFGMTLPFAVFSIAEWRLFRRQSERLQIALAIVAGVAGLFFLFAAIVTCCEALSDHQTKRTLDHFVGLGLMVAASVIFGAYFLYCCYWRLTHRRFAPQTGFAVVAAD